eukprot:scaffold3202_cov407-Prasinococcus_capsulatus_cf.AAC.14
MPCGANAIRHSKREELGVREGCSDALSSNVCDSGPQCCTCGLTMPSSFKYKFSLRWLLCATTKDGYSVYIGYTI